MKELTERQQQILQFISDYTEENSFPPTVRETAEHFSVSLKAIQDHFTALTKKGYLLKDEKRSRSLKVLGNVTKKANKGYKIPVLGSVAAGKPIFCEEDYENMGQYKFVNGKVQVEVEEEIKTFDYADLAMSSSISMENLKVTDVYTTVSNTDSNGAMTLTCEAGGIKVTVRTVVLRDADNQVVTGDAYMGKTIDVRGIIDYFSGEYQIKVISAKDITVH